MLDEEYERERNGTEKDETELLADLSMKMRERTNRRNKIKTYVTKNKAVFEIHDSDSEEDQLGNESNYQLKRKELTLEERETEEELELTYVIEQMNLEKKEKEQNSSDDSDSDNNNDIRIEQHDYLKFAARRTSLTDSNYTKDSSSKAILPDDHLQRESFFNQNIINYEQLLKVIVIGKTGVGKSLFIQNLMQQGAIPALTLPYSPTTTLQINKTTVSIRSNYKVNLELWDTCATIVNSELIKTYYKLANGFVLLADIDKDNKCDIAFITKQIERIYLISAEDPKLLLMINTKGMRHDIANDKGLTDLVSKYYLQVMTSDINAVQLNADKDFLAYLNKIARTKKLSFEKPFKRNYYSTESSSPLSQDYHKSMSNSPGDKKGIFLKECSPFNHTDSNL